MSIDYNSFMQGVITGLKLGRTKLGRQPPVPSGRYILTESGEKAIMEYFTGSECSIYPFNYEWPAPNDPRWSYFTTILPYSGEMAPDGYFFKGIIDDIPYAVVLTTVDLGGRLNWKQKYTDPYGSETIIDYRLMSFESSGSTSPGIIKLKKEGVFYYAVLTTFEANSYMFPSDVVPFVGTVSQLEAYVRSLRISPMITEGG